MTCSLIGGLPAAHGRKTIAAVDGTVALGKEGHLRLGSALSADGAVHFAGCVAVGTVVLV